MARYSATLDDQYGRPYGALVSVSLSSGTALAALTADDGSPLANPLPIGPDGAIIFNAASGLYDLAYYVGGRRVGRDLGVPLGDVSSLPAGSVVDFLGTATNIAPSQRAVQAGLDAKANLSLVTPLLPLTSTAARTFTGATNGTDVSAALLAASTAGPVIVPPGVYTIGTSVTLPNVISFSVGARLAIANAVTVTFGAWVSAGEFQIFNLTGTGAVAGLAEAKQAWFDGDLATLPGATPSATICDTALQAAFNALLPGGVLYGDARVRVKGTTYVTTSQASYDGRGASYLWNSATTAGFNVTAATPLQTFFGNFNMAPLTAGTIPTIATAVVVGRAQCTFWQIQITDPYIGIDARAGVSNFYHDYFIYGAALYGVRVQSIDQYFNGGVIQALSDWVTLSGVTGTFNVGDALTNGASVGNITAKYDATHYRMFFNDILPAAGQTITSSSGGSATIAAATVSHQLGGIRMEPASSSAALEAVIWQNTDVLGGLYSLTVANVAGGIGRFGHMAFCRFDTGVYFDSSYNGALIDGAYGNVIDAWFANARSRSKPGAYLTNSSHNRIRGHFTSNSGYGLQVDPSCTYDTIDGSDFDGNCRKYNSETTMAELYIGGAIQRVTVANLMIGFTGANGINPPKAIYMDAAASDYVWMNMIQAPNGSVTWGSTGTHNKRRCVSDLSDI